jgi:hypothetical protein
MAEYDDPAKEIAWKSFWKGYSKGYGVEELESIDRRAALAQFEQWWTRQMEQ